MNRITVDIILILIAVLVAIISPYRIIAIGFIIAGPLLLALDLAMGDRQ